MKKTTTLIIILLMIVITFSIIWISQKAPDNACQSIGYEKAVYNKYCEKGGQLKEFIFSNCFWTCDIYEKP